MEPYCVRKMSRQSLPLFLFVFRKQTIYFYVARNICARRSSVDSPNFQSQSIPLSDSENYVKAQKLGKNVRNLASVTNRDFENSHDILRL